MENIPLKNTVHHFPQTSGVYLMKDAADRYLYIGKALNLRSRVLSYFSDSHEDRYQIPYLMKKVTGIEWIATNNETEALILEANLIRAHKPPYNCDLKDDKHFPYLKVTINERFPRLIVVRRVENDGARYFGPFTETKAMRQVMDFAQRAFSIRSCNRSLPSRKRSRPCINYAIRGCIGACAGTIDEETYRQRVSLLLQFLKGQRKDVISHLEHLMHTASDACNFEEAASIRDQLSLIKNIGAAQRVDLKTPGKNCDVFGLHAADQTICLCILSFRQGMLIARRFFTFKKDVWERTALDHDPIVLQFYRHAIDDPPEEIILPQEQGFNCLLLQPLLEQKFCRSMHVTVPQKGTKTALVALAEKNARLYLMQKPAENSTDVPADLARLLYLPRIPQTIEAFDISNLGDKYAVAGMVRFTNGIPDKTQYRRYKIKTVAGQNDFAMLLETVTRRLKRLHDENQAFPDLLLIDGGAGQLSAAAKPLHNYPHPPMICALAKKEETLLSPGAPGPVHLPSNHPVRLFCERIRDEAHRWVITYHRTVRDKQFKHSTLEHVPGIGVKKARVLLNHFGSVKKLRQATVEQLSNVPGFSRTSAENLLQKINSILK